MKFNLFKSAVLATAIFSTTLSSGFAADLAEDGIPEVIKVGVVPGPYRDYLEKYLQPIVKQKGHELKFVEFTDWLQPDFALDSGDIDANVFQHQLYLDAVVENQGLKLASVTNVPTLGLFVFSDKYKSLDEVEEGATVGIPNDPVNLARALRNLRDLGVITLKADRNDQKASLADIDENKKNLEFVTMEAAQLSRSLDSLAVAVVPGNYTYAAKLDLDKALGAEVVAEPIKNVVAVQTKDVEKLGAFLKDAVRTQEFVDAIDNDPVFNKLSKPEWWPNKQ